MGELVKLWGTGFSVNETEDSVSFDGGITYVVVDRFIEDSRSGVSLLIDTLEVEVPLGAKSSMLMTKVLNGSLVVSSEKFIVLPTISSISPDRGSVSLEVTISGSGFSPMVSENTVTFGGGVDGVVGSGSSSTELIVSVPEGAVSGPISVSVNGEVIETEVFTIVPTISSISPDRGSVSLEVTISGSGFSPMVSENTVTFGGGVDGVVSSGNTSTELMVSVPEGAVSGPIEVLVNGEAVETDVFTVEPTITNLDVTSGIVGAVVRISGSGFSPMVSENSVTFLGTSESGDNSLAAITSVNGIGTELVLLVPNRAVSGPVEVNVNGEIVETDAFEVLPTVSDVSPSLGFVGTRVKLAGTGFSPLVEVDSVSFDGGITYVVADVFTEDDRSGVSLLIDTLEVLVPLGAETGKILVKVLDGTASSSVS